MDSRLIWFERLYENNADAIWRHLYFRLGDKERAEELMHDVFMNTWTYVQSGKEITHEKAFLYKLANNLFINEIRTDKKTKSLETLAEEGIEFSEEDSPLSEAERTELLDNLEGLREDQRTILVMRYIDGLAVQDIAEILKEQENTISMRIKRAVENLKEKYEGKKETYEKNE